ncbi:MAG: succinate dehydrogenase, cytochrome b556 subunit [Steroidobacteraceae bacterium]
MAQQERPLSPFMHYRWQYSNGLSILHRLSGVFMSAGFTLLVYWLVALASGSETYDGALRCFASPLTKLALFGWLLAFFYHLLNGIRHLGWDMGYGFERAVARKTGTLVMVSAVILTVLTWLCITARITATASAVATGGVL